MKLENESGLGIQSPPRKSYNPFDSDDEDTNDYVKGSFNYDVKSLEKNADSLTFHLDAPDLSWEEAILAHSQILDHKDATGEQVLYRKDTRLFTDKTVTECELPELMVCYKDNTYNSVKDIGIDEGVPTHDKIWIKSRDNEDMKDDSDFLSFENEHQGVKSRSENRFEKDAPVVVWGEDSVKDSRLDGEALERQQFASECGTHKLKKVDEIDSVGEVTGDEMMVGDIVYDARDSRLSERGEVSEESSTKPSLVSSSETTTVCNENQSEEATSSSSQSPDTQESAGDGSIGNVVPFNSKVESGSIILDFNSAAMAVAMVGGKEEDEEKAQVNEEVVAIPTAKPPEGQTMSRREDSMDRRVHGETSFSAAMAPPGSITYTGPHAHTGSMSLRSESSAGSTRSFAFPVLQAEWNSSPVRMAKADERRKHRGWVHSLMCCRFF